MGTLDLQTTFVLRGGGKRDRTADLLHAMQALSQLSYTPHEQTTSYHTALASTTAAAGAALRHNLCQNLGVPTGIRTPVLTVKG